jgi:hypothetical protein
MMKNTEMTLPVACVRPLQGTDSEPDFSTGNTLPGE